MEIKKEDLDRIVITSNEQMQKIIDWFFEERDYIDKVMFEEGAIPYPLKVGTIQFVEENIEIVFWAKPRKTEIEVYLKDDRRRDLIRAFSFWFDPQEEGDGDIANSVRDLKVFTGNQENARKLRSVIAMDNTPKKLITKFLCIMMFMLFNQEIIEVDRSQDKPRTKREVRRMKSAGIPMSLVRKTYVIKDFDEKKLRIPGQPRKWTAPDREVAVRGHYRHLKSGKVVWVRECTKFKEKGNRKPKEWKM